MSQNAVVASLQEQFAGAVLGVDHFRGETTVTVAKDEVVRICSFLKTRHGYNFLCDITGIDYLGRRTPRFEVAYNLYSIGTKERLRLKVQVAEEDARVATVSGVWATANWLERECWDLMGIFFVDHPDLRRILMPADWEGHPLRKDYPVQGPGREPYKGRLS